jgi:hypothetical protein
MYFPSLVLSLIFVLQAAATPVPGREFITSREEEFDIIARSCIVSYSFIGAMNEASLMNIQGCICGVVTPSCPALCQEVCYVCMLRSACCGREDADIL